MEKLKGLIERYFISDELSPESRTLNFVCLFGAVSAVAALISRLVAGLPFMTIAPLILMIIAICSILFLSLIKSQKTSLLTAIIVYGVSIVFWPYLFFTIGGSGSGMAVYFALAIILDFTLLTKKTRVVAIVITSFVTIACYASTLFWDVGTLPLEGLTTYQLFIDIMQSVFIVGFLVGVVILFQTRLYQNEKNKAQGAADEIKQNEQLLKQTQRTVSAMFEANPQINILFDNNFKLIDCNPAAVSFFAYEKKEALLADFLKRITESIPKFQPDGRASIPLAERLIKAITEGYVKFETELHVSDKITRNLEVVFKRIPYGDNYAIVGYIYDMTEIYEREKELKLRNQQYSDAVEDAKAANLAKSNFLATMSHEIRTPMNAILGITEINLHKDLKDNDLKESFEKISVSGNMLLGIINDILDLSKIEAGKLELVYDRYEIASLISDTAQLNMMRIGSKEIDFELYVDENVPTMLYGDELRVKQILNNVLSNAFKYTEAGMVKLSVVTMPCGDESRVKLVMSVSDTGQGMTKEQVAKLFDEYARFNMEANRSTEGTGLGMSITQNLLNMMGGEMTVESEPGAGSTFTFSIIQEIAGFGVLGKEMVENLQNFRTSSRTQMKRVNIRRDLMPYGNVLIVDDVETNIYVAKGLLAPYELKIDSAESGMAAIDKVKNGRIYDIIFMDHMMPKMDGIEATRLIREMGYTKPIVALTANAVTGQADLFLGNGFDDYISKPIDTRQLNSVLNKLIRDMRPEEAEKVRQMSEADALPAPAAAQPVLPISQRLAEAFVRDAKKSLAILGNIFDKGDMCNDVNDIQTFTIYAHGMKSALANFGRMDLSAIAGKLEASARDCDIEIINTETPKLLDGLKSIIEDLSSKIQPEKSGQDDATPEFLKNKLLEIKTACDEFDDKTAEDALSDLMQKTWPQEVDELLNNLSAMLLHSEFDEAIEAVTKYLS